MRLFIAPIVLSAAVLLAMFFWGGADAFLLAAALALLEISLSFDNAVLNAKVLARMDRKWQRRFLTWGMLFSVFVVRFILPVLIISVAALESPAAIAQLAFNNPDEYARLLESIDPVIHAFGGAFLLMVALSYFFDEEKRVHWVGVLERRMARWGSATVPLITPIAVVAVGVASLFSGQMLATFCAGVVGIGLYLLIDAFTRAWGSGVRGKAVAGGFALFVYLNVLDAAFSLDGVVGAFALTTQILVILAGLGIGAYFVRTITLHLTRRHTIETFVYLEHGAHWAIFSLALCLFAALFIKVPEVVPGTVGLVFALLSYLSSRRKLRYK